MMNRNETDAQGYATLQEAFAAATEAAALNYGRPVPGILYSQAGRRFIAASLPVKLLLTMARRDSLDRKKGDPSSARNRPLDQKHVEEIVKYLSEEQKYLMPPIILNVAHDLQVFPYKGTGPTRFCVIVLPPEEYLYVTDGQHRLEALRQAMDSRPDLENDAIGVTIIEEHSIDKVHQDFYDAAQVKSLARALLVEYDGREPVNGLTRDVTNMAIFKGRVERIGTVGKHSLKLFTTNQIKQGVLQLVVGDWSLWGDAMQSQAHQAIEPAPDLWHKRVLGFFDAFTEANAQWHEVEQRPLESAQMTDIPNFRQEYLHFTGGGLLVLCGVGHSILEMDTNQDGALTPKQQALVEQLASLDWSRKGNLWQGYLVGPQGNVTPHKNYIVLAVAKVKETLGLTLTAKEERTLLKASEETVPTE